MLFKCFLIFLLSVTYVDFKLTNFILKKKNNKRMNKR